MAEGKNEDNEDIEDIEDTGGEEQEGAQTSETPEGEPAKKKKKQKKVIRRRKTKKEKEKPITSAIRLAVESGKVGFGARTGLMAGLLGKARLFVVASNTPAEVRGQVEKYSSASGIPVIIFEGSSIELGSVCGKPFPVSVLSVYEAGTSPIMDLAGK